MNILRSTKEKLSFFANLEVLGCLATILLVALVVGVIVYLAIEDSSQIKCEPQLCWITEANRRLYLSEEELPIIKKDTRVFVVATNHDRTQVWARVHVTTVYGSGDSSDSGEDRQLWIDRDHIKGEIPEWLPVRPNP